MFKFADLKFKVKLGAMIGAALLGMIIFAAMAFRTLSQVEIGSADYELIVLDKDLQGDYLPPGLSIDSTQRDLLQLEATTNPDDRRPLIEKVRGSEKTLQERHDYYRQRIKNPKLREALDGPAYTAAQQYFRLFETQYLPIIQSGQLDSATEYRVKDMTPLYDQHVRAEAEALKATNDVVAMREQDAKSTVTSETRLMLVLLCLIIGTVTVLCTAIVRSITRSVGELQSALQKVAAGDLTVKLENCAQDEIGQIGTSLNKAVGAMRSAVAEITEHAETIADATEEVSASATQVALSSRTQQDQTTQVATAMHEMSSSVVEVSSNAGLAAEASRTSADTAKQGGKIVQEALANMRTIAQSVETSAKKIQDLGKSSDQIGKIVAVIEDIADQTNLLALNAAIEAARAGEQGRGFAVVADEVRKLAERTAKATKEIADMIQNVQKETATAVAQMQAGTAQVEMGVATTAKAGTSLEQIIVEAQHVGDMVSQIAAASNQQSETASQINQNVEQIARITTESSAGVHESAKACENLSTLASELQQIVSRFKVDDDRSSKQTRNTRGHAKPAAYSPVAYTPQPHAHVADFEPVPDYYSNPTY